MATIYWSGAIDTDIDDYRNYVTGENADPSSATIADNSGDFSGDNVIFQSLAVSNVSNNPTVNANETFNSIRIDSGCTLTGNSSFSITVDGEADGAGTTTSGYAVDIDGALGTNVNLIITTADTTNLDIIPSSGNVHNLTINLGDAARIAKIQTGGPTLAGNLTITSGQLSTENNALTVTGTTTIGPNSGVADQATLTCGSGTISLGALRQQADYALNIEIGGTFVGGTGTHTFGSLFMAQSANAKATMTTGQVLVNGYNNSANKAWRVEYGGDTFDNANGTVKFQFNGFDSRMSMRGASHANNAFHNLIIHMAGDTRQISPDNGSKIIVDNDLTITRGKLVMGLSHALEVGGNVVIDDASNTAELEMGSSSNISSQAATFGSLTIGGSGTYKATSGTTTITNKSSSYSVNVTGTYTHNSGTLKITTSSNNLIKILTGVNNLVLESATGSVYEWVSNTTIQGDLTINAGRFAHYSPLFSLDVEGDCAINNTGTLTGGSGSIELGSLSIASGGTYSATTGTTTITNQTGGGYAWYNAGGTFTHNDGLVKFTDNASLYCQENTFYDLELNLTSVTLEFRWSDISGNTLNILNDFTISSGRFKFNTAGDGIIVHGLTKLKSTSQFGLNSPSGVHTFNGLVTINGGTWNLSSGTNNMSGIRNVGGTIA